MTDAASMTGPAVADIRGAPNVGLWWKADIAPVRLSRQNRGMHTTVNLERVRWALEELSDEREQRRLWLSDGTAGKEISSLVEAECGLFDDSHLGAAFEKKQPVLAI